MTLEQLHSEFLIYEENLVFLFYQCIVYNILYISHKTFKQLQHN
jgi:hypothetical protein